MQGFGQSLIFKTDRVSHPFKGGSPGSLFGSFVFESGEPPLWGDSPGENHSNFEEGQLPP